jgi:hypothetical protein
MTGSPNGRVFPDNTRPVKNIELIIKIIERTVFIPDLFILCVLTENICMLFFRKLSDQNNAFYFKAVFGFENCKINSLWHLLFLVIDSVPGKFIHPLILDFIGTG